MGLVSPTQVSDGSTADASDINTPVNQIAAVINGNIDNSNVAAAAAIDGSKIAANSIDIGAKASVFDGWIAVSDTWTYASATTVTVPSNAATKYSVGDKVRFTNSGTKYFYITAVAATTLTLNGGSDYTVANAAITVPYYSKAETPLDFPQWFNYTSALVNSTLGNGTMAARFTLLGKTCHFRALLTLGSTSAIGSTYGITLPVASKSDYTVNDHIGSFEGTRASLYPGWLVWASSTTASVVIQNTAGTYGVATVLQATVPATWTTGDKLHQAGTYEVA